jgi:hypothetical protein
VIRARLGITSDTSFQAYDNHYNILLTDNYPTSLSKLDARIYDILTDANGEESYVVTAPAGITNYTSALTWSGDNTALDIMVFVNGKKLTQDQTGSGLKDFQKTNTNKITFTFTVKQGAEIAIYKVRKGGGHPGFLETRYNQVAVNPITQYLNFTGAGVTVSDGGLGLTNVAISGGTNAAKYFVVNYKNTSGATLAAMTVCAFDNLGGMVPADANVFNLSDFAGLCKSSLSDGNFGEFYVSGLVPLALVGLGAIPGQLVYLGESPGTFSLIPPPGTADNLIILGKASPEDATAPDGTATALLLSPQILSLGV